MKISAYIICKDEEAVLARCIQSFQTAVDEIVVVDSGSTDHTLDVAHSFQAKVTAITWQDDFSYARNVALSKCSGDWIIPIDADEYFSEGDADKIRQLIARLKAERPDCDGLMCNMINIDPKTKQKLSQILHVLAFKKTPGMSYVRPIHEQLKKDGRDLNLLFTNEVSIMHTGTATDEVKDKQKLERNIRLLEASVQGGIADASDYYHLTQLYLRVGKPADTVFEAARKMVELDGIQGHIPASAAHRKYTLLATVMIKEGMPFADVMAVLDEAYGRFAHHPEVLAARGDAYLAYKRWDDAIASYEDALLAERAYSDTLTNGFSKRASQVSLAIAELYQLCGKPIKALDQYYLLLQQDKYNASATLGLLHLIRLEPAEDSVQLLDTLYCRTKQEDVGYLIGCFSTVRSPALFLFYVNIWQTRFQKCDASIITALFLKRDYECAVKAALEYLKANKDHEIGLMACAGIVLGNLYSSHELVLRNMDAACAPVLDAFRRLKHNQPTVMAQGFSRDFIRVYSHIVSALDDDEAMLYIKAITKAADPALIQATAGSLLHLRRYELLEKLHVLTAQKGGAQAGQYYYLAGVNAVILGAFSKAQEYFHKALLFGFSNEEMRQYDRILKECTKPCRG